ncbi:MAG: hypothetical protein GEU83_07215 [Pseudonocardiaceae bacterium]|nr:hypothetical protein [Pseudonocardiaceae bacterium]
MDLVMLRDVLTHQGPMATAYLEARSPSEDAAAQIDLRWRDLLDQLDSQGADADTIAPLREVPGQGREGWQQGSGHVVVAAASGVLFAAPVDAALGTGDRAHWGPLPQLGDYARARSRATRQLIVLADQEGATVHQLTVAAHTGARELVGEQVRGGSKHSPHKARGGGVAHTRAEEAVYRNADDVVNYLGEVVGRFRPEALVLAGEVQGRQALRSQFPDHWAEFTVETGSGGRDSGVIDEQLIEELHEVGDRIEAEHAEQVMERFHSGLPERNSAQGLVATMHAARTGAIETLLVEQGVPADGQVWIGPEPEQLATDRDVLRQLEVTEPEHEIAEPALLRACAALGGRLLEVPNGSDLVDGVGALLRFDPGH